MTLQTTDPIADLQADLREFARRRDWEQYHTPRNLAALIASEAGELLAHYRWGGHRTCGAKALQRKHQRR